MTASIATSRYLQWSSSLGLVPSGERSPMKSESQVLGATATLVSGRIYIVGRAGRSSSRNATALYYLDVNESTWHWIDARGPYLMHHVTILVGDRLYVFGGLDKNRVMARSVWGFDLCTKEYCKFGKSPTVPRMRHNFIGEFVERIGRIVIFGGYYEGSRTRGNDVWLLEMESMTWVEAKPRGNPPSPRSNHASCTVANHVFIFGGYKRVQRLNDLHVLTLTPTTVRWSKPVLHGLTPGGRSSHSLTYVSGKLFVFGGSNGAAISEVAVLDLTTMEWLTGNAHPNSYVVTGQIHPGVYHAATVGPKGNLYVFGGRQWKMRYYRVLKPMRKV